MERYYRIDAWSIYLEPADNGYVVYWNEQTKLGPGHYDGYSECKERKEIFKPSEGAKALARVNELYKMAGKEMEEEDEG